MCCGGESDKTKNNNECSVSPHHDENLLINNINCVMNVVIYNLYRN